MKSHDFHGDVPWFFVCLPEDIMEYPYRKGIFLGTAHICGDSNVIEWPMSWEYKKIRLGIF